MTVEQLVRERAAEIGVRVSIMLSECRRKTTTDARKLVVRYVVEKRPETTLDELAEFFGVTRDAARYWLKTKIVPDEPPKWPKRPEEIVEEWKAKMSIDIWRALCRKSRTRAVKVWRWQMVRDINARCPGITSGQIGKIVKLDHSSVRYILLKGTRVTHKVFAPADENHVSA